MSFYHDHILPHAIHCACGVKPFERQRAQLIPQAHGDVLEIGVGSGLNIPHYRREQVKSLTVIDPSEAIWKKRDKQTADSALGLRFINAKAEHLPLESNRFDVVVTTYTLCTIADTDQALYEIRRVLRPGGKLLFSEHGSAPDLSVRRWQNRLTPLWKKLGGGCHLNRDIPVLLKRGGFNIVEMESFYLQGWRPAAFNYRGIAAPQ